MEPATQEICNDGMDNMQAEAGAGPIATRREERIEGIALDIEAHAAIVVGKQHINRVVAGCLNHDVDGTCLAIGKGMRDRV